MYTHTHQNTNTTPTDQRPPKSLRRAGALQSFLFARAQTPCVCENQIPFPSSVPVPLRDAIVAAILTNTIQIRAHTLTTQILGHAKVIIINNHKRDACVRISVVLCVCVCVRIFRMLPFPYPHVLLVVVVTLSQTQTTSSRPHPDVGAYRFSRGKSTRNPTPNHAVLFRARTLLSAATTCVHRIHSHTHLHDNARAHFHRTQTRTHIWVTCACAGGSHAHIMYEGNCVWGGGGGDPMQCAENVMARISTGYAHTFTQFADVSCICIVIVCY